MSWDKDFGHQRYASSRFAGLFRIGFSCPELLAVERVEEVADIIGLAISRSRNPPPEIKISRDKVQIRGQHFRV